MQTEITREMCALNLPYPDITQMEIAPNTVYVRQLQIPYAGHASELTAITTYVYQGILFSANPESGRKSDRRRRNAATVLEAAAIDEMHHFRILGTLIERLGCAPKIGVFHRGHNNFWNSSYTNYECSLEKALEQNIADERKAAEEYRVIADSICHDGIRKILERIAKDEEHHAELFCCVLNLC
ncbi:MAG: ferritin family protein [Eubacteriales bacterium]